MWTKPKSSLLSRRDWLRHAGGGLDASQGRAYRSGFDDVASVTALGPYDVAIKLRRVYSPAVATFFTTGANDPYPILPAHVLAALPDINTAPYNAHPIGLGPYRLASWEHGSRLVLVADPHFRRGAPHIARVEFAIVPDSNTALAVWRSGGFDVFPVRGFSGGRALLDGARTVVGAREFRSDHYQFNYVMFQTAHGPLHDRAVREALVRGIDRERIERDVRGELYRPGDGDRLPGQFAYDPTIREAPYDPAGAAKRDHLLSDSSAFAWLGSSAGDSSGSSSSSSAPPHRQPQSPALSSQPA